MKEKKLQHGTPYGHAEFALILLRQVQIGQRAEGFPLRQGRNGQDPQQERQNQEKGNQLFHEITSSYSI